MTSPGSTSIGFFFRFGGGAKGESFEDELGAVSALGPGVSGVVLGAVLCAASLDGGSAGAGCVVAGCVVAGCGGICGSGSGGAAIAGPPDASSAVRRSEVRSRLSVRNLRQLYLSLGPRGEAKHRVGA
jgi:hypothetical protein